uniref:phosphatidate cytidylyltransferase n=1 Tax=Fagus sylvatica TaxID=28930 RepID=A0A2N9F784_FAGSY
MATTSYSGIGRYNYKFLPLSLSSMRACPCRSSPSKPLIPARPGFKVGFVFDGRQSVLRLARNGGLTLSRVITAVARAEPDRLGEDNAKQEVDKGHKLSEKEDLILENQQKASQLEKRIVFGLGIGITVGGVVLAGGWVFTVALAAAVFVGAREYFELVRSRGITAGMTPPPRYVSRVCSVICAVMPILTL